MGNHQQLSLQKVAEWSYEEVRAQSIFEFEIPEDYRLGYGLIIKNTQLDLKLFLQTQTYTLLSQFNQKLEEASLRSKLTFPSIINLIKFNGNEYENKLGKSYKISLLYEFKSYTLSDDLQFIAQGKNSQLSEKDLYRIIDSVLSALLIFKHVGIKHGFIQPSSIFMKKTNDQVFYCLNDIQFMNGSNEYKRLLNGIQQGCYLSPKLLVELGQRIENPVHIYEKSEIFSLGLTILECVLLEPASLHDFDTFLINFDQLESLLTTVSRNNKFSSSFLHILRAMLAIDENSRLRNLIIQYQRRFAYQELILSLQNQGQKIAFSVDQYLRSLDQPKLKESRSLSPLTFKNTTHEGDFQKLYRNQQAEDDYVPQKQSREMHSTLGPQRVYPQPQAQKESQRNTPSQQMSRGSQKNSNNPRDENDSQRFQRQQTQPQSHPEHSQVVIPRPMSTSAQRTPERPGTQSQVVDGPRNLPPTFRNNQSTRIANDDQKDLPKSPIQRMRDKKSPQPSASSQMQRSGTVKKQPQSVVQDQEHHPFDEEFKRLEQKLSMVQSNIMQYKRPSVRSNYVDDQEVESRLPQSSVIHMHSGNSMFLNDIFKKDDSMNF